MVRKNTGAKGAAKSARRGKSAAPATKTQATSTNDTAKASRRAVPKPANSNSATVRQASPRKAAASKASASRGASSAARSSARSAAPATVPTKVDVAVKKGTTKVAVLPIREERLMMNGVIRATPQGTKVSFRNVETGAEIKVSRNLASTVELAFNVLAPTSESLSRRAVTAERRAGATDRAPWLAGLVAAGPVSGEGVVLTPRNVLVAARHPDQIVEADGLPAVVYDVVLSDGHEHVGHLFAVAPKKFVLNAPTLQSDKSTHMNADQALVRLQIAAEDYVKRRDAAKAPSLAAVS